jgi:DMSO reductase anchor subunit
MHPAPSIIVFTVMSGLGFGMLFWMGIQPADYSFAAFFLAFACACGGLLSSTFHLGNPQRALKAFSQWKSSWLSREAVLSVLALGFMGIFAAGAVFANVVLAPFAVVGGLLSLATVATTSMIYAQMKTVPRWHQWTTPALFLALALTGGAIFVAGATISALLLVVSAGLMVAHWSIGDRKFAESGSNMNTATGLNHGTVRAFEPPHTGTNYLMKEMVFTVGRKHATQLRAISIGLAVVLPVLLIVIGGGAAVLLALISHLAGVFASRWLFFAEAEHVVGLYYGQR